MPEILPSILAADFTRLGQHMAQAEAGGVSSFHLDVMDGRFAPNFSIGIPIVEAARRSTKQKLDVHLMIVEPDRYVQSFIQAGADCVSVHQEACTHLDRTLRLIQSEGALAGVVLNPMTPVSTLDHALDVADYVLLMSVNPGFGGQKFIPYVLGKASALRETRRRRGLDFAIEIDGGITVDNIGMVAEAGVDWFVAGSSVFGTLDPAASVAAMRKAAEAASLRQA
ncbi:MAG TPA: ribulose-phosphate 3-epimerase [Bryobacteraceae bacterium]|nr:ribulose-phosphate 3-epimerase [Bryobacteraceae bacterium]HPT28797.1 ribulose-phosphate 3-epimerase [Bryobacteraceae bacterium]